MLRQYIRFFIFMLFISVPVQHIYASNINALEHSNLNKLYETSPVFSQQEKLATNLIKGMKLTIFNSEIATDLPKGKTTRLFTLTSQIFSQDNFQRQYLVNLDRALTAQQIDSLIQWRNSPIIQDYFQQKKAASKKRTKKDRDSYIKSLDNSSLSAHRLELLNAYDNLIHASHSTIENILVTQAIVEMGFISLFTQINNNSFNNIATLKKQQLYAQEKDSVQQDVINTLAFLYQDLSDIELNKYIEALDTVEGRRYFKVITDSYNQTFHDLAEQFAKKLMANKS